MWRSSAAQHSQSLEAWYAHIPGLVVVCPATPEDNKGLLKSAIRSDDPVVYLEHKLLWPLEGEVPAGDDVLVPIGQAKVVRPGKDLTLVTWSATVHVALQAASELARSGVDVEIIDLRTLWPWDKEAVFASVERTGRLLVAHEAVSVAGFGAEIVASVCEAMVERLLAPPLRVAAPRIHIGYAPTLEDEVRVTPQRLIDAALKLMKTRTERMR
jgi:pyruvate dehydrogenase E1 component beta subunit